MNRLSARVHPYPWFTHRPREDVSCGRQVRAGGGLLSVKRMVEETYGFAQNLNVRVKKPLRARRRK